MMATLKAPGTIEQLSVTGSDRFVAHFHLTENAVAVAVVLNRLELAKACRLFSEALRTTQDQVTEPEKLAAVAVEL